MTDTKRAYKKDNCSYCGKHKFIAAKGLCRACYLRKKRNGHLEKIKIRHSCSVDGCSAVIYGQGYCEMHYYRVKKHGDPHHNNRPKDWGKREEHHLYQYWTARRRSSAKIQMSPEWHNDFWLFCKDVGDRPSKDHYLRLIDESGIYEKGNVQWVEKLIVKRGSETKKEYARRYAQASRVANPKRHLNNSLKKSFGITLIDYEKMTDEQKGVCAICGNKETTINPRHKHGMPQNLSVDHDHKTGKIRGLLCKSCNQAIGLFKENIDTMQNAINYLNKFKQE